jgi:DNA-directed RNA polymerase specialized sigma24 family protein
VMSTFFSAQSDAAAVSDLRVWGEKQLIAAAKGGRRAPFGELCERHVKKVFRVIHRIMGNREDAEDALQDCPSRRACNIVTFCRRVSAA